MVWHFHPSCHGSNITVRQSGSRAVRHPDTFDNGISFSDSTIQFGDAVSLFFKKSTDRWSGMPRIGFTNQNPDQVDPKSLPPVYMQEVLHESRMWAVALEQAGGSIFVDYSYDEMGLVTVRQLGQPEKLLDTRGAITFKTPVWATIDLCGCHNDVMNSDTCAYIPQEIVNLGSEACQMYLEALTKGSRNVRRTRLVLVGQGGVGKTSLMKKLTNQRMPSFSCGFLGYKHCMLVVVKERKASVHTDCAPADDGDILLNVWDFAGHDLYNSANQVFLSHRAIFILVFNLGHDLDEPAIVKGLDGKKTVQHHELTTWEYMDHWMRVIHACVGAGRQSQATSQRSPPIVIVGTHRNSLGKDAAERVGTKFAKLREMLSNAPYQQHVVGRFFAVENSLEDANDTEVIALRTRIEDVACSEPYMVEEIPLKWLQFEDTRRHTSPIMSSAVARRIIVSSIDSLTDAEILMMLEFYHSTGQIICLERSPGCLSSHDARRDVIIVDPRWLTEVFKRVATAQKPPEQYPALLKSWTRLKAEGILEERLIDHLWRDILVVHQEQHVDSTVDTKDALLGLMCKFDLLCKQHPRDQVTLGDDQMETSDGQDTVGRTYFVPSSLHKPHAIKRDPHDPMASHVFYVDFMHFLPDSLFSRLVVRALVWSQEQEGTELEPRIAHRHARFFADGDHEVEMEMSPLKQAYIKVCVKRLAVVTTSARACSKSRIQQSAPSPAFTCKVKEFLSAALDSIKSVWFKGLKFHFCVSCPCDPEGALHFLSLNECLKKERTHCPRQHSVRIDTSGIREMFCESVSSLAQKIDPYVMSEKHLRAIAAELGQDWERLATDLGFTQSNLYRFRQDNSAMDSTIFSMLVAWSQNKGGDARRKVMVLREALVGCGRRDVAETLLAPHV